MGKVCRHCGMESDRDQVCSWCNMDLTEPAKPAVSPASTAGQPHVAAPNAGTTGPAISPLKGAAAAALALETERRSRPAWLYAVVGIAAVVQFIIALQFVAFSKAMKPPAQPTEWQTARSHTGLLMLQVPGTWRFSTAGSSGSFEQVLVRCGPLYKVSIDGGQAKGALSDVAAASARQGGAPAEFSLHETLGMFVAKSDSSYKEEGEAQSCQFAGQAAASSTYTARRRLGLWGVQVKGMRMSCPGNDLGYDIRIEAPARHFEQFLPLGQQVLSSVQMGPK